MKKTVLITGATSGIGKSILEAFLKEGHNVIGTFNKGEEKSRILLAKFGDTNLSFLHLDQSNPESINTLAERITGNVDVLINNAGLGSKTVENITENKFEQDLVLMQTNSLGPLWLSEAIIKKMNNKGKIINISSVGGGIFHYPGFRLADGMSKAALTFMTKQMAAENIHTGIDIFAICPGATETEMLKESTLNKFNEEEKKAFIKGLPKGRLISPSEIANLCKFLSTDGAEILHGAVIDSSLGLGVNPGSIGKV